MPPRGCATAAIQPLSVPPSVTAYCRQARRLRGRLARQPARMHRELRALGSSQPQIPPTPAVGSHAREFAGLVEAELEGCVLRYARRRALVSKAKGLGIPEFHANLLIAAVQHERRGTAAAAPVALRRDRAPDRIGAVAPVLVVLVVEVLVGLGVWQMVGG